MISVSTMRPFTRCLMTIGQIPTSYLVSMTYEEQLLWLCNYLEKEVIPALNNNAEALKEVQDLYVELKKYVDDYFSNLDVQEEINNKLDEMAESGQLADIIAQYLGLAGVLAYDTKADLKSASNIDEGSICKTLGETEYNDGKGSFYKIRNLTSSDVIDDDLIVALANFPTLIAEKIPDYEINDLKNNIEIINNALESKMESVDGIPALQEFHIDATNGDDDNDGLTRNRPMKTLSALFNKYVNKGRLLMRIRMQAGTYLIDDYAFNSCGIHFFFEGNSENAPITINFTNKYYDGQWYHNIPFYDCHINFYGESSTKKFILNGSVSCDEIYLDGGSMALRYVDINNMELGNHGGHIEMNYCNIKQLYSKGGSIYSDNSTHIGLTELYSCVANLRQTTFEVSNIVSSNSNYFFAATNCIVNITGSTYIDMTDTPVKNNFFYMQGGTLSMLAGLNKLGENTFSGEARFEGVSIQVNQTRWDAFKNIAQTYVINTDCVYPSALTL